MKTRCRNCRKLIEFRTSLCEECSKKLRKDYKKNSSKNIELVESTTKSSRWKKLRKQIILRDKCCCRLCMKRGYVEFRKLEVHHIVKRVDDPSLIYEPSNLVTLCRTCHEEMEKLNVVEQKRIIGDVEEIEFRL